MVKRCRATEIKELCEVKKDVENRMSLAKREIPRLKAVVTIPDGAPMLDIGAGQSRNGQSP